MKPILKLLIIEELLNKVEKEFKEINTDELVQFMNKYKTNPLNLLESLKSSVNEFTSETKT